MSTARAAAYAVTMVFVGMAGLASCKSDDSTGTGGGGGQTPANYKQSTCNTCIATECSAEISACGSDPGCTAYLACIGKCPLDERHDLDAACDSACGAGDSTESSKLIARVRLCHDHGPGGDCAECGSPKSTVLPPPPDENCPPLDPTDTPCHQCYFTQICQTYDACFDGAHQDCDDLGTCFAGCDGAMPADDCVGGCFDEHPTSVAPFTTLLAKELTVCHSGETNCDPATQDTCETCAFETCGDTLFDLMTSRDGFLLYWCFLANCTDGAIPCIEGCVDKYPAANEDFFLWTECLANICDAACQ